LSPLRTLNTDETPGGYISTFTKETIQYTVCIIVRKLKVFKFNHTFNSAKHSLSAPLPSLSAQAAASSGPTSDHVKTKELIYSRASDLCGISAVGPLLPELI
jgi:hypothetical protein